MNKAQKTHLPGSNKKEDLRMKPVMPAENLEIDENSTEKYTPPGDATKAGVKQRQPSQNRNKNNSANPGGTRQ
jgi:hypothetical protein